MSYTRSRFSGIADAEQSLIRAVPLGDRSLEVGEVLLRDAHRFGLVGDGDVDDAVRHLHRHRPDLVGMEHAEAAAFDHRGAAHPDARVLRGDDDVGAAEQRRVAREAPAGVDRDEGDEPAEVTEQVERHAVEPRETGAVGVAGTASTAFREDDDREPQALGELEHPVLLTMVLETLGAGEDGVVVRHDHAP